MLLLGALSAPVPSQNENNIEFVSTGHLSPRIPKDNGVVTTPGSSLYLIAVFETILEALKIKPPNIDTRSNTESTPSPPPPTTTPYYQPITSINAPGPHSNTPRKSGSQTITTVSWTGYVMGNIILSLGLRMRVRIQGLALWLLAGDELEGGE